MDHDQQVQCCAVEALRDVLEALHDVYTENRSVTTRCTALFSGISQWFSLSNQTIRILIGIVQASTPDSELCVRQKAAATVTLCTIYLLLRNTMPLQQRVLLCSSDCYANAITGIPSIVLASCSTYIWIEQMMPQVQVMIPLF